ncbi:tetratricopeptide repeat protein, partial [bacterium]|nr:tetratricopeptide repeat protein [bacterium]
GRLDEALTHFEQSMEHARASGLAETLAAARLNLVDVRTRGGSFPVPDPVLDEAVESAAGTRYEEPAAKLLVERGVALAGKGHLPDAVGAFDQAIALRPAWPFPVYQRAWVRFLQGDSGGALDDYREVARGHPVFFTVQREIRGLEDVAAGKIPIESFRSYCIVRGEIAKNAKAVEEAARRIVERFPSFAPGWVLLAEACLASGQGVDEARRAAHEALQQDPDPDTAVAALFAEWHFATRAGDPDAAHEAAERLRTAYPDYPAVEVIRRLADDPDPRRMVQWTWAMDGSLHIREFRREETPPGAPPASD